MEQTLSAGWALDPVQPTVHIYAKMALNLIEKVANPTGRQDSRKRKRSEDSASGSGAAPDPGQQSVQPLWHVPVGEPWVLTCLQLTTCSTAVVRVLCLAGAPPAAVAGQLAVTEEEGASEVSEADSAADSGTEDLPEGGPGRGSNLAN